jgi:RHH-type rel operon transcriptional repressor/antitoxin RelB
MAAKSIAVFMAFPIEPPNARRLLPGNGGVKASGVAQPTKLVYMCTRRPPMSKQTAVRLPDETYERLQNLASRTGRTATFYIREAIEEKLQDLEDLYLAEEVTRRRAAGESKTYSLEEIGRDLGLDD